MPEENLGAGLKLTKDWDLEVDATGDLASVSGSEELQKDSAMLTGIMLDKQLGTVISTRLDSNSLKEVELLIERTIVSDERIRRVVEVDASVPPNEPDIIEIEMEAVANDGENHELIYKVDA